MYGVLQARQAFQKKNGSELQEMMAACSMAVAGINAALIARLLAANDSNMTSAASISAGSTRELHDA